jgi:hypothetical protein
MMQGLGLECCGRRNKIYKIYGTNKKLPSMERTGKKQPIVRRKTKNRKRLRNGMDYRIFKKDNNYIP